MATNGVAGKGVAGGERRYSDMNVFVGDLSIDEVAVTATAAEINNAADATGFSQELLATGAVTAGVKSLELNHTGTIIAATAASAVDHAGFFYLVNTSASGTAAHKLTLTAGTFDGTNNIAGRIIVNTGSVALS